MSEKTITNKTVPKKETKLITIDGPAGAGKSSVAKQLAAQIGFYYLDTGALYRTVALLGLKNQVDWNDPAALVSLTQKNLIDYRAGRVYLNQEDVSEQIRSSEITFLTQYSSKNPAIRLLMNDLQRKIATTDHFVTEGRDQGSVVFPDAFRKFYLTASPEERARRRFKEQQQRGENVDYQQILIDINERDYRDSHRDVAPLIQPKGAIIIDSDGKSLDEVVELMKRHIEMPD